MPECQKRGLKVRKISWKQRRLKMEEQDYMPETAVFAVICHLSKCELAYS